MRMAYAKHWWLSLLGITDFDVLLWNMDLLQAEAESVFVWH